MKSMLRRPEARVVLCLLLMLAGLEVVARLFEQRLSKDVQHIRSLPAVAAKLQAAPDSSLKVLILGNSLSRDGLNPKVLKEGLQKLTGREVELAAMYPDGSSVSQWFYGYRRYFSQAGAKPDLVFIGTARQHLLDARSEADRLAAFYTSYADMPLLLKRQHGDVEAISKALLARASVLFAHRGRVQPLVFYNLVPGYTETTQNLSVHRGETAIHEAEPSVSVPATPANEPCWHFQELIKTLQADGATPVVVTIPMTQPYQLPDSLVQSASAAKVRVESLGSGLSWSADRFPDGYHLAPDAGEEFTRMLVESLQKTPLELRSK